MVLRISVAEDIIPNTKYDYKRGYGYYGEKNETKNEKK